ncbi:MAG: MBL fold metallo-hydrolase [Halanaerobium sp.]
MAVKLKMTILVENTVYKQGLLAEHGLSIYLEFDGKKYLFDSGQGLSLKHNAQKLGIALNELDGLILSHGHYDHTGGVPYLLEIKSDLEIYAHPDFQIERYSMRGKRLAPVSYSGPAIKDFNEIRNLSEIGKNMFLTGEIKNAKNYLNKKYMRKNNSGYITDNFSDDLSLYFESKDGLIIILGCSHKGVENIIKEIINKSGLSRVDKIIGGMHLMNADKNRLKNLSEFFKEINPNEIYPLHCSGKEAASYFRRSLGDKIKFAGVGSIIEGEI